MLKSNPGLILSSEKDTWKFAAVDAYKKNVSESKWGF